jgi:hypothetical protein
MTTPAQRNEIVRRQSRAVFSEIAEAAFSLKNLTALLVGNGGVTETDDAAILGGIAALVDRVGMLADLGSDKCGGGASVGGVAEWTLPSAYFDAEE